MTTADGRVDETVLLGAEPTWVGDRSLDTGLAPISSTGGHLCARVLIRLHGCPLGEVELAMPRGALTSLELQAAVRAQLADQVRTHLAADGLPSPATLLPGVAPQEPACRAAARTTCASGRQATVVVATRGRSVSLLRCLESLCTQEYPNFDVVVVDSAPPDTSTETALINAGKRPFRLRYVRTSRPGVAVAHNAALPFITGDVVAFTDDDVQADPHWLTELMVPFTASDVACVTGLILPAELDTAAQLLLERSGGFARGFEPRRYRLAEPPDRLFPFTAGRFGSGANMAFRTDWLRSRGGFDPAAGTGTPARGGDDLLSFLDVIMDGRTLAYQPGAIVRHYHRRELTGLRRQAFGYGVGLGAYLTAAVYARPALLVAMARRAGAATRHFVSADSEKNRGKGADFPAALTWRERAGALVGPAAYAVSRHRARTLSAAIGTGR